jgi:hypothetical protein
MSNFAFNDITLLLTEEEKKDIDKYAPQGYCFADLVINLELQRKAPIVATYLGLTQDEYVKAIKHDCDVSIHDYLASTEGKKPSEAKLEAYKKVFKAPYYKLLVLIDVIRDIRPTFKHYKGEHVIDPKSIATTDGLYANKNEPFTNDKTSSHSYYERYIGQDHRENAFKFPK